MPNNLDNYYFVTDYTVQISTVYKKKTQTVPEKIKEMWERSVYFKKCVYKPTNKDLLAAKKKGKPYYRYNERWG